ncbi:hypothetical protein BP6252_09634 [Coleophoma cylindrospora]|uniref:Ubiquitin-like domain-containing protein n=1 Tax=Coleophoma cylindrospora TaxID=1849047 RepID=A0A3D8QW57_9HELO|nr:hypothetical protein BP6252_09634 [Coleophoma cylindrospora]
MSFGFSVGDCILVLQIARNSYENCRAAGSEYTKIAREVKSLYSILTILRSEVEKTESPLFRREGESTKTEISYAIEGCKHILEDLQTLLAKYKGLSGDGEENVNAGRKLWHRIRFGSKAQALEEVRVRIITYTSTIAVSLDAMQLKATGRLEDSSGRLEEITVRIDGTTIRVEDKINEMANNFLAMKNAIVNDELRARAQPRGWSGLSLMSLSTYSDDDKDVWQEFRREMVMKGFKSHHLERHKDILTAYMLKLRQCGVLDQLKLPANEVKPWWMQSMFLDTSETLPGLAPIIEDESLVRDQPHSGSSTVPQQSLSNLPIPRRVQRDAKLPNTHMERILAAKLESSTPKKRDRANETSERDTLERDTIAGTTMEMKEARHDTATLEDDALEPISTHASVVPGQRIISQTGPLFKAPDDSRVEVRTSSRMNKFAYAESIAESGSEPEPEPELEADAEPEQRPVLDSLNQRRRVLVAREDQGKGPSSRSSNVDVGLPQEIEIHPQPEVTHEVLSDLHNRQPKSIEKPVSGWQPSIRENDRQQGRNRSPSLNSLSEDSESEIKSRHLDREGQRTPLHFENLDKSLFNPTTKRISSLEGASSPDKHSLTGGSLGPQYTYYWVWTCCRCWNHSSTSPSITTDCPGCSHLRCTDCSLEKIKTRTPSTTWESESTRNSAYTTSSLPSSDKSILDQIVDLVKTKKVRYPEDLSAQSRGELDDLIYIKHRGIKYCVAFPAYSTVFYLTVRDIRERAAATITLPNSDIQNLKLFYKGKQLKDDDALCCDYDVRDKSEILCMVSDGSEDSDSGSGGEDSSDESTDSRISNGAQDLSPVSRQQTAKAALLAGMTEAFRLRNEPGDWAGLKGRRVLTAALAAAQIDRASRSDE